MHRPPVHPQSLGDLREPLSLLNPPHKQCPIRRGQRGQVGGQFRHGAGIAAGAVGQVQEQGDLPDRPVQPAHCVPQPTPVGGEEVRHEGSLTGPPLQEVGERKVCLLDDIVGILGGPTPATVEGSEAGDLGFQCRVERRAGRHCSSEWLLSTARMVVKGDARDAGPSDIALKERIPG